MITEFIAAGALVYSYNYLTSVDRKIKKTFNDIMNNYNLDYKIIDIKKYDFGYKLIVSLFGSPYDKLENIQDVLQSSFANRVFIEQNKNFKTATVNIVTEKITDSYKFEPFNTKEPYKIYAGLNYKFEPLIVSIDKFPHILVTGQTGTGKTEIIRIILTNLISNFSEKDITIYFSDLSDMCDFDIFKKCKQVNGYAKDLEQSEKLFNYLMHIYTKRLSIFSKHSCKNIKEFNNKFKDKKMSYSYLILDEFADYFPVNKLEKEYNRKVICYNLLKHMVRKFRKAGIFLIVGIQRPDTTVLDPSLRSNICTKIGFSQNTKSSSLVVCDTDDLTNIENREGLFMFGNKKEWFKSLYIDDKLIKKYIKDSKVNYNKNYNSFLKDTTKEKNKRIPQPSKKNKSKAKVKLIK